MKHGAVYDTEFQSNIQLLFNIMYCHYFDAINIIDNMFLLILQL